MNGSVRPSAWLSAPLSHIFGYVPVAYRHVMFWTLSDHHVQKSCPGKRSRSEDKGQGNRGQKPIFPTVNPVWIHRRLLNDAQSLKQHRRGAVLFFKIVSQISRSHVTKMQIFTQIECFRTVTPVWIHRWQRNDAQSLMHHMPYCFSMSFIKVTWDKNRLFWPELGVSGLLLYF